MNKLFSAIEIGTLGGLQRILVEEFGKNGPYIVGQIKNPEAFMQGAFSDASTGEHDCRYFNPSNVDDKLSQAYISHAYHTQVIKDVLDLDESLGFEKSSKWSMLCDQSQSRVGNVQRRGWHQDSGCTRIYGIGWPNSTVALKDSAPAHVVPYGTTIEAEKEAREGGYIVEAPAGSILLFGPNTWHRSPIMTAPPQEQASGDGTNDSTPQKPLFLDRTCMVIWIPNY